MLCIINIFIEILCPSYLEDLVETKPRSGLTNLWPSCLEWHAAFTDVPVSFYLFFPTSVSVLWRIYVNYVNTYIWLRRDCTWIVVATKWYREWNISTQMWSIAKCWLDICEWGCRPGGDWADTWRWTERFTGIFLNRK